MNGVAAIVAIQAAGLAVSQALWSGISIFVAYIWGAMVFQEPIAHPFLAIAGAQLSHVSPNEFSPPLLGWPQGGRSTALILL